MDDLAELGLEGMNLFTDKYFDTVYDKLPPKDQLFKKRPKFLRDRFGRLHRLQWHDRNGAPVAPGDKNAVDVTVAANPKNSGDPQGGGDASDPRREQQQNGGGDNAQLSYEEFRQDQQEDRPSNGNDRGLPPDSRDYQPPPSRAPTVVSHYPPELDPRAPRREDTGQRRRRRSYSRSRSRDRYRGHSRERRRTSVGANVVGALAGGLAGRKLAEGGKMGMLAGAVVGALGAGALEDSRNERSRKKDRKRDGRESGRRYDDTDDDYDDYHDRRRYRHG